MGNALSIPDDVPVPTEADLQYVHPVDPDLRAIGVNHGVVFSNTAQTKLIVTEQINNMSGDNFKIQNLDGSPYGSNLHIKGKAFASAGSFSIDERHDQKNPFALPNRSLPSDAAKSFVSTHVRLYLTARRRRPPNLKASTCTSTQWWNGTFVSPPNWCIWPKTTKNVPTAFIGPARSLRILVRCEKMVSRVRLWRVEPGAPTPIPTNSSLTPASIPVS